MYVCVTVFLSSHSNCVCLWGIVNGSRGLWVAQIRHYEELLTPQTAKQILKRGYSAFILPVVSSMISTEHLYWKCKFILCSYFLQFIQCCKSGSVVKIILFLFS